MANEIKLYECDITESFIRIEIDINLKIFWIVEYYFDPDINKTNLLGVLLYKMINDITELGIEYMTQTVYLEDWDFLKKNNNWEVINFIGEHRVEIRCKIEDVFDCLLDGFNYDNN